MPARTTLLSRGRPSPVWLAAAAAVPLAAIALADSVRVRRRLHVAGRDELTGLPRRQALTRRGERLLACRTGDLAVLMCDIDDFKAVNDSAGHAAGDLVLDEVASRLLDWTSARGGMVARLGGDEFGAYVRVPYGRIHRELATLPTVLERPVVYDGQALPVAVSVGVAHTAELPGASWGTLLRVADVAMYRAKTVRPHAWYTGPCLGLPEDADTPTVNGRRAGRPGTHLVPAARTATDTGAGAVR